MGKNMKKLISTLALVACLGMTVAVVTTGCAGDRYHRSTGKYIDDKTITAKVKADLLGDPDVKGTAVKVDTYNGRVQLSGFVDTIAQKNRAAEIARNVEGVQWVQNNIAVK
jgi:osmotically-inducible protein OsmY